MYEALKICMPITLMTFAIFTRSNMVVNPGWQQVADTLLVLVSTCGITFAMFGRFHEKSGIDIPLRVLLALVSFVTMFHPDTRVSAAAAIAVLGPARAPGSLKKRAQSACDDLIDKGAIITGE